MMRFILLPLLCLPLFEIIGFVVIGGRMGLGLSLLWLVSATLLGFSLLRGGSAKTLARATGTEDFFLIRDFFDDVCLLVAALLLIFPGFISDFIAIPFMVAPLRHLIYGRLNKNKAMHTKRTHETVIDGEFRRTDNNETLPRD